LVGSLGVLIGTGQTNTTAILADCPTSGTAAQLADYYSVGIYNDWFLPSADELSAAAYNTSFGLAYHNYQVSSEVDANNAIIMRNDGYTGAYGDKSASYYVRPIRSAVY